LETVSKATYASVLAPGYSSHQLIRKKLEKVHANICYSADANVRDAIARGLIPGPRLFVATQALASTGSFEDRTENAMNSLPAGADACDGVDEVRKAVRRRIAAGADVIKYYADYRRRVMRLPLSGVLHPPKDSNPNIVVFSQEEMDMIVREAALAQCPVSAHASSLQGALMAVKAGVTSIEHGSAVSDTLFQEMKSRGCIMVPTLAVLERLQNEKLPQILAQTKKAHDAGVRIACGGDTGTFSHGENAREMELMVEAGIPIEDVLESCTVGGWESCGGELSGYSFGWFEKGCRADIIALNADPRDDEDALRKVDFVMKDAKIWKRNGEAFGMI
jgi:imidazolonepropionase-like amidohydrolase